MRIESPENDSVSVVPIRSKVLHYFVLLEIQPVQKESWQERWKDHCLSQAS
jgi:hypothetical protein